MPDLRGLVRIGVVAVFVALVAGCPRSMTQSDAGDPVDAPRAPFDAPIAPADSPSPPDASPPPDAPPARRDAGPVPDGGSVVFPPLPAVTNGTPADPEREPAGYGCLGVATAPARGSSTPLRLELRGFGSGDAIAGARVHVFPDGIVSAACTGSCIAVTTDAGGNAMVSAAAGGWLAYSVLPRPGSTMASTYVGTREVNVIAPVGGVVLATAVSMSTLNLIPAAYGFTRVPGSAMLVGGVRDCDDEAVRGALVRVFAADGREHVHSLVVNDAPHIQYFDGNENPDGTQTFSSVDGLYAAVNLPADAASAPESFRVEAWGVLTAGDAPTLLGCELVPADGDAIGMVTLRPLRSDYPAGHPCRGR